MNSRPTLRLSLASAVFLVEQEDWRTVVYDDVAGNPTIGVGHLLTKSELTSGKIYLKKHAIKWSQGLKDVDVMLLLAQDVAEREAVINELVTVPLAQHQFDALLLFVFNIGREAFAKSTLLRLLNVGAYAEVTSQLHRWIYARGKPVEGLKVRRATEAALWNNEL
jgi:lysozyme